tara:strand:+ start:8853 stop:9377 length:525 start_codon:yes stop_codon:yes gene_type:complete
MSSTSSRRARLNPQRVKIHFSFTVNEIAELLGVHKNTVRSWLKNGLEAIDLQHPILVKGATLRTFLEVRRRSRKQKSPPGTLYCLKCRQPNPPALGMVDFIVLTPTSGNLMALCQTCGTVVHRRVRTNQISAVMPGIHIQFSQDHPHIRESGRLSLNCDSGKEHGNHVSAQRRQ